MKNAYTILNGQALIQLSNGPVALIEEADLELVASVRGTWFAHHRRDTSYAWVNKSLLDGEKGIIQMHRLVTGAVGRDKHVDHIDLDGLNNLRHNLRITNASGNGQNVPKARSTSVTGVRGVGVHPCGKFRARVTVNRAEHHLGLFDTIEEAEVAAIAGRRRLMTHAPECVPEG